MILEDRIIAFAKLGDCFLNHESNFLFDNVIKKAEENNSWFTEVNIKYSLLSLGKMLRLNFLKNFTASYLIQNNNKKIGVIVPGNIPLVGFYDFFCTLISGNIFIGKLSSSNNVLLPHVAELLCNFNNDFKSLIFFKTTIKNVDLLIATGNNNSAYFFNHLYYKIDKIIRKNRVSIAIINGFETKEMYKKLAYDIYVYFGLGCRNVSKLFLPRGFNIETLKMAFQNVPVYSPNQYYIDNYMYQKAIFKINHVNFIDFDNLLLIESNKIDSPISVLYYEYYDDINDCKNLIQLHKEKIQCVVSEDINIHESVIFGNSQNPKLHDFPDGIDVLDWIISH